MLQLTVTGALTELTALMARLTDAHLQEPCTASGRTIQADYVITAPKQTTSMVLSCYVVPALGDPTDNYAGRTNAARAVNPKVEILPELPAPPAPGAVVGVAAGHGALIEYGNARGTVAARPRFTQAVERERAVFPLRVEQALQHG